MEECDKFIKVKRESRHLKTLECQKSKFERLCQKNTGGHSNIKHGGHGYSNISTPNMPSDLSIHSSTPDLRPNISTWVKNISRTPHTEAQEQLLAHGPNFAVVPRQLPIREYVAAVEKVCQQLKQGAEELRGEIKDCVKQCTNPQIQYLKRRG